MKSKITSAIICIAFFSVTLLTFQNCSTSDSGGSNGAIVSSLSEAEFNETLMLLMINAGVPSTQKGVYTTFSIQTVACGFNNYSQKNKCTFFSNSYTNYSSYLNDVVEVETHLKANQAPTFRIDNDEFSYIRNLSCTGNTANLADTRCSYDKTICSSPGECGHNQTIFTQYSQQCNGNSSLSIFLRGQQSLCQSNATSQQTFTKNGGCWVSCAETNCSGQIAYSSGSSYQSGMQCY